MKKIKKSESIIDDELPIATIVIDQYKKANNRLNESKEHLQKTNKILSIIVLILLVFVIVETTYIILYWETMHPHSGVIQEKNNE